MQTFDKGDLVRVYARFKSSGTAVDPSTVKVSTKDPSGNKDDYTYAGNSVAKEGTGIYYRDVSVDEVGTWFVRVESTGSYQSAIERSFYVRGTEF